ncbi:hypothetical protein BGY98DRAFT_985972 [Russula aff. rugulosa BPL654]|nr:hypothetical protein BGY98DRAFT_985972 [Russula aff. rugulosa BPL654]
MWTLDLNCLNPTFWESYEPAPGNEKPLPRYSHVSVTTEDRIIMFVPLTFALYPRYIVL